MGQILIGLPQVNKDQGKSVNFLVFSPKELKRPIAIAYHNFNRSILQHNICKPSSCYFASKEEKTKEFKKSRTPAKLLFSAKSVSDGKLVMKKS